MNYIIFCSIVVLVVILGGFFSYLKVKKYTSHLKKIKDVAQEDFYTIECQSVAEEKAMMIIKSNIESVIYELNQLLEETSSKINKYELKEQIKRLKEECNNIDVIINAQPEIYNECVDIADEIQNLIETLPFVDNKVKINIQKGIETKYIFDYKKLISALRIIISKSLRNGENEKIDIDINCIEKINSTSKIGISIKNIHLIDKDNPIFQEDLSNFFNMERINPDFCTYNERIKDPELYILRENILNISGTMRFNTNTNTTTDKITTNLDIILLLERKKEKKKYFKALIVDDMEQVAKMNQEVLRNIKIDSDIVLSGKECLKKISENYDEYDIIFTDNQMPEMNGTELLQELKKENSFKLPVVIVTSDNGMEHYFKETYGFNDYVVKPLTEKVAKKIIKEQLESKD